MAKKKDKGAGIKKLKEKALLKTLTTNFDDSDRYVNEARETWEEKEKILIGTLADELSTNTAKSQVYDPRLSTIVLERASRVMGQIPTGKVQGISQNDKGKAMLMNLTLDKYCIPNANSQFDYLIKSRLLDVYSLVYGVMFALVDWRVDERGGYIGPDFWIVPIRDAFPQAGSISVKDCERFQVSNLVSQDWLERRGDDWDGLDEIIEDLKKGKGMSRSELDDNRRSHVESSRHSDIAAHMVELRTEYRIYGGKGDKGEWITYAPEYEKVVRRIDNPHENGELPLVEKHAYPLLDSIFGLGEFERGKTLQYAINSLINLYLDGVKQSLFPPIMVNPDQVIPSTIKWQPAAKWLVRNPQAISQLNLSPQGLATFQSTYSFLISALLNQAGTTDTTTSKQTDPGMGKTPEALKLLNQRENSRDSWDRFMMEKTQEGILKKFVNLISRKQEKPIKIRLFEDEIEEIQKTYPDVMELFGDEGLKIKSNTFKGIQFDYQLISGSTEQADSQKEVQNLSTIIQLFTQQPQIIQMLQNDGKDINLAELITRWIAASGIQDWDKIVTDFTPPEGGMMGGGMGGDMTQFQDPDIASAAQQILGNIGSIPPEGNV